MASSEKGPRNFGRSGPYHTDAAELEFFLPLVVRRITAAVRCTHKVGMSARRPRNRTCAVLVPKGVFQCVKWNFAYGNGSVYTNAAAGAWRSNSWPACPWTSYG